MDTLHFRKKAKDDRMGNRKVEVLPYQQNWPLKYEYEAQLLRNIFQEEMIDIYHIGSTSIMGMSAKPVIDILMVVTSIDRIDAYNGRMSNLGYEAMGEFGIKRRRFFQKGGDARTYHVHVFEEGNREINRHVCFRDYLRVHQDQAKAYSRLKEKLAVTYPNDMESYIKGKDAFIKAIEQAAIIWKSEETTSEVSFFDI